MSELRTFNFRLFLHTFQGPDEMPLYFRNIGMRYDLWEERESNVFITNMTIEMEIAVTNAGEGEISCKI